MLGHAGIENGKLEPRRFAHSLGADWWLSTPEFRNALAKIVLHIETELVKRSDQATGFVVLPKRSIVECTFAWLNRCRRLARDWEKALAFLRLVAIRLMLRKLCNPD